MSYRKCLPIVTKILRMKEMQIMATQITNSSSPFVFWLFNWATHRIFTSLHYYPQYICCDIDASGILIDDRLKSIQFSLNQIKSCEVYRFSQGLHAGPTSNVKLELIEPIKSNARRNLSRELYLVPVNLFHNEPKAQEMEDMVHVINTFRAGHTPLLPTNPYEREFIRLGKASEFDSQKWNALTPPNIYTPVPNPFLLLLKLLLFAVVGTLAILVVIGIIYNLLY